MSASAHKIDCTCDACKAMHDRFKRGMDRMRKAEQDYAQALVVAEDKLAKVRLYIKDSGCKNYCDGITCADGIEKLCDVCALSEIVGKS